MNRPMYDRRSWTLKRFFGESFKSQSLADFGCPAPGCSEKTLSRMNVCREFVEQSQKIGFAGGCNSEGKEKLGPP